MILLVVYSLLLGAVLALRFKVLILIPVIILGMIVAAIVGIAASIAGPADPSYWWWLVALVIAGSTALQVGYLGGSAILFFILLPQDPGTRKWRVPSGFARSTLATHQADVNVPHLVISSVAEDLQRRYRPVLSEPLPEHLTALVQRL